RVRPAALRRQRGPRPEPARSPPQPWERASHRRAARRGRVATYGDAWLHAADGDVPAGSQRRHSEQALLGSGAAAAAGLGRLVCRDAPGARERGDARLVGHLRELLFADLVRRLAAVADEYPLQVADLEERDAAVHFDAVDEELERLAATRAELLA